jgi:hypothetical protein
MLRQLHMHQKEIVRMTVSVGIAADVCKQNVLTLYSNLEAAEENAWVVCPARSYFCELRSLKSMQVCRQARIY